MPRKTKEPPPPPKAYFSHPSLAQVPFEPFNPMPNLPKTRPPDSEVEEKFSGLIDDLNVNEDKRKWFNGKAIAEKWDLYCDSAREDSETPSPSFLIQCLSIRPGVEVLQTTSKLLAKGRKSWVNRFVCGNGHQLLLSLLAQYSNKFNPFIQTDLPLADVISWSLTSLRHLVNTTEGAQTIVVYTEAIPIIVSSMHPRIPHSFEHALTIELLFMFANFPGVDNLANIKAVISSIGEQQFGWKMFTRELTSRPDRQLVIALSSFLKGLLLFLHSYHRIRMSVSLKLYESGLFKALKDLKYEQGDALTGTLQTIFDLVTNDITLLSALFSTQIVNPFSNKSICQYLKAQAEPTPIFNSILLSVFDIVGRYPEFKNDMMIFMHNFLTIARFYLSQNDKSKLKYSATLALGLKKPIMIPFSSKTYRPLPSHESLHERSFFICDPELATVNLAQYLDGANILEASGKGGDVETQILTSKDMDEMKAQMEEQIHSLEATIKDLNTSLKLSIEGKQSKEQEIAELNKQITEQKSKFEQQLANLEKEKTDLNQQNLAQIQEKENELQQTHLKLNEMQQQLEKLVQEKEKELDESEQKYQVLTMTFEKLKSTSAEQLNSAIAEKDEIDAALSALTLSSQAKIKELEAEISDVKEKSSKEGTAKVAELTALLATATATAASLQEAQDNFKQEMEQKDLLHQQQQSSLRGKIEEMELAKSQSEQEMTQIHEKMIQIQSQISTLEADKTALVAKLDSSQNEKTKLIHELEETRAQKDQIEQQLKVSLSQGQSETSQLAQANTVLQQQLGELNKQVQELERRLQDQEVTKKELEEMLIQKTNDFDLASQHITNLKSQHDETVKRLKEQAQKRETEQNEKIEQLALVAKDDSKLQNAIKELNAIRSEKSQLQQTIDEQKMQINDLTESQEESKTKVATLTTNYQALQNKFQAAFSELESTKHSLNSSQTNLLEHEQEVQQLKNEIDSLRNENQTILECQTTMSDNLLQELAGERQKVREMSKNVESMKATHQSEIAAIEKTLQVTRDKNAAQVQNLENQLVESQTKISSLTKDSKGKSADLEAKLDAAESVKKQLANDLKQNENEIKELKKQLAAEHDNRVNDLQMANMMREQHSAAITKMKNELAATNKRAAEREAEQNAKINSLMTVANDDSKVQEVIKELQQVQQEKTKLQAQIEANATESRDKNAELEGQIHSLHGELDQVKSEKQRAETDKADLLQQLAQVQQEMAQISQNLEETQKVSSQKDVDFESQVEKMKLEHSAAVDGLQANLDHAKEEFDNSQLTINQLQQEIAQLKEQIEFSTQTKGENEQTFAAEIEKLKASNAVALQSATTSLQQTISQLKQEKQAADAKIVELEQNHIKTESELRSKSENVIQLQEEIQQLNTSHEEAIKKLKAHMADAAKQAQQRESEQNQKISDLMLVTNDDSKLQNAIKELNLVQAEKSQLQDINDENKVQIKELHSQLKEQEDKESKLKQKLEDLKQERKDERKLFDEEKAKLLGNSGEQLQSALTQVTTLTATVTKLETEKNESEKLQQKQKDQILELESTNSSLKLDFDRVKEEQQAEQTKLRSEFETKSKADADKYQAELNAKQVELQASLAQITDISTKLQNLEAEKSDLTQQLSATKNEMKKLEEKNAALVLETQQTSSKSEGEASKLIVELKTAKESIIKLEATNAELQNSSKSTAAELSSTKEQLQKVETQVKSLETELEKQKTENEQLKHTCDKQRNEIQTYSEEIATLRAQAISAAVTETAAEAQNPSGEEEEEEEEEKFEIPPPLDNPDPPQPMRPLFWNKIPDDQIGPTLWNELRTSSAIQFDGNDLVRFFKASQPILGISSIKVKSAALFVAQTKKSIPDLIKAIQQLANWISDEQIDALLDMLPTPLEQTAIEKYTGPIDKLEPGEQFIIQLSRIAQIEKRLRFMKMEKDFDAKMDTFDRRLLNLHIGITQLKSAQKLRELFTLILKCGNYMNGGTAIGGAYGFTLDSLANLATTPSNQAKLMMTHFLILLINQKYKGISQFTEELTEFMACKDFDINVVAKTISEMNQTLTDCIMTMPEAESRALEGDFFFPRFMDFYGSKRTRLDEVKQSCKERQKELKKVNLLLGASPETSLSEIIGQLEKFQNDLNSAVAENRNETPASKQPNVETHAGDKGVLDNLVSNIQASDAKQAAEKKKAGGGFFSFFK